MALDVCAASLRVSDAIPLPRTARPIVARTARHDAYEVHVVAGLRELLQRLNDVVQGKRVAVITDDTVASLYGALVLEGLRQAGCKPILRAAPAGERSKSLAQATALWDWLAASDLGRRDVIVTLGGGVIADLGGWVASAYMRGVPYVNLPTTLLAQVDGALGGKVAANHPSAKNLLGAFHQPSAVIANIGFLRTTSLRHLRAGLAEAIKKAIIASPELWAFIEDNAESVTTGDPRALEPLVRGAVAIKTALIERDPYEDDLRRPLNFGHTVGHPLETVTGYGPLLHGEAVAFGMVVESRLAVGRGVLDQALFDRIVALLRRCGLPTGAGDLPVAVDGAELMNAMEKVRLIRDGSLRWVLPAGLGESVITDDIGEDEVAAALAHCGVRLAHSAVQ